jgi:hypothetical protein
LTRELNTVSAPHRGALVRGPLARRPQTDRQCGRSSTFGLRLSTCHVFHCRIVHRRNPLSPTTRCICSEPRMRRGAAEQSQGLRPAESKASVS